MTAGAGAASRALDRLRDAERLGQGAVTTIKKREGVGLLEVALKEVDQAISRVADARNAVEAVADRVLGPVPEGDGRDGEGAEPAPQGQGYELQRQLTTLHRALTALEHQVARLPHI